MRNAETINGYSVRIVSDPNEYARRQKESTLAMIRGNAPQNKNMPGRVAKYASPHSEYGRIMAYDSRGALRHIFASVYEAAEILWIEPSTIYNSMKSDKAVKKLGLRFVAERDKKGAS